MSATEPRALQRVCSLEELRRDGIRVVSGGGRAIAVFLEGGNVFALDNRCPHMGFPFTGAPFETASSPATGTMRSSTSPAVARSTSSPTTPPPFAVEVSEGEVWLDTRPPDVDGRARWLRKLDDGLDHNVSLVLAKSAIALHELGATNEAVRRAALFGLRNRAAGWSTGLSILTAAAQVLPLLSDEDKPLALFHGLRHVAASTAGQQPNFDVQPLRGSETNPERYGHWFRRFVEVRQAAAAERTLVTAVMAGLNQRAVADMIFAACTDHLYLDVGHTLDFANKAFELLDLIGWEHARDVPPSLIPVLVGSQRMEESSSWRHPVDIVGLVQAASKKLLELPDDGRGVETWDGHERLAEVILDGDPAQALDDIVGLARAGVPLVELSASVAYAAVRRALHSRSRTRSATGRRCTTPSPMPTPSTKRCAVHRPRRWPGASSTVPWPSRSSASSTYPSDPSPPPRAQCQRLGRSSGGSMSMGRRTRLRSWSPTCSPRTEMRRS
jgi:nitrite reductase/ring-hydroxylating ferredoxin subunit